MKAKRKGPRYVVSTAGSWVKLVFDCGRNEDLLPDEVVRDLNAGERAKAEVKRLRSLQRCLDVGHTIQGDAKHGEWWCHECGRDLRP